MTVRNMTCAELVELVTDYLEDVMPADERSRFEQHLAACEGCSAYVDQMRRVIRMTGRLTEDDVPQPAAGELLRVFRDWRR